MITIALSLCFAFLADAPALDAIHSFKTSIQNGKIHVIADPQLATKENKARPPKMSTDGFASASGSGKGVVIVGGGAGGINTVESLREVRMINIFLLTP